MVNAILLHIVSNISDAEVDVGIIPEFQMESTRFKYAATSYGDVVNFLIVKGPPDSISKYDIKNSDCILLPAHCLSFGCKNFYLLDLNLHLPTQKWSNMSRQTFMRPREMDL